MRIINPPLRLLLFVMICLSADLIADTQSDANKVAEVPFGDRIDNRVFNYNRLTPTIATSGVIKEGGIQLLKAEGFQSVLDLRTPGEGTPEEEVSVTASGMAYTNLPIGKDLPTTADLKKFAEIVESPDRGPLLIHCASANRVGTIWAMYRLGQGAPVDLALREARTIGMKASREPDIKSYAQSLHGSAH